MKWGLILLLSVLLFAGGCACQCQQFEKKTDEFYYWLNHWDPWKCDCDCPQG